MPKEFHDSIAQPCTVTGTGNVTLAASTPFPARRTVQSTVSVGASVPYRIEATDANYAPTGQWETGEGKYIGTDQFERTTPQAGSSGNNTAVNFAAGTKKLTITTNAADLRVIGQLQSPVSYTYNADKTVATYTVNGVTYTVNYTTVNGVKAVGTVVGGGVTQTISYNGDGTVASIT